MIQKVLQVAENEIGYLEKKTNAFLYDKTANAGSNNYTKYAKEYAAWGYGNYQAQPWCAMFVTWVFKQAGLGDLFPPFAYCPTGVNNFKKAGQWHTDKPSAGDVIFFRDSKNVACHVGIVCAVDTQRVYTIEGNTTSQGFSANGGAVAKKNYPLNYTLIMGYGRPKYTKEELTVEQYEELNKRLASLENPMVYNYIDGNLPDWAKPTIQKLVDKKLLTGTDEGLGLTDEILRLLVINDRAGLYN
ncbi:MAG: CHAP domain-containing protein [Clostridiales bacterium]|jgi:hypothetical protein|nr:CHAP domain-containing protein [Clostridiales bacterium]